MAGGNLIKAHYFKGEHRKIRGSFFTKSHMEKHGATGTSCTRRSFISTEERYFYSYSLEQHAQECDKVALIGSFRGAVEQGAG